MTSSAYKRLGAALVLAALFVTDTARSQTYTSLAVTASFNGYSYTPNMVLMLGNLWQGDFFLYLETNRFVFTSGASTWWGETNQTSFVPPLSGIAETNPAPIMARMIVISNEPLQWYRFRFDTDTREYSVFGISNTTTKLPPVMTVAGSFNNWQAGTPNMEPISHNLWQGDFLVTTPTGHFKFTINNWQYQFGDTNPPGRNLPLSAIAERVASGHDIFFTNAVPGYYRITFNSDTYQYTMRLLYSITSGINLVRNPSFETQGSSSMRAYNWEWGSPDTNGGYWGSASRESWRSRSGTFLGVLRGRWSGNDFGGYWQHSPALSNRTYRASAWFWNDPNWTCTFPEFKIEFFDSSLQLIDYANVVVRSTNTHWTRNTVTATAPTNAVGVRVVIAMYGAGNDGALQFDDVELRAVSDRTLDFEVWPIVTNDTYIESDWILSLGRVMSNQMGGATITAGVFISEYVEGSSYNKALEIYNGTTNAINLTAGQYYVQIYANGDTNPTANIALTGTVAAGQTYVICHSQAAQTVKDVSQLMTGSLNHNGNDAIVLRFNGTTGPILDRFGRVGEDPGTSWGGVTADRTLRRKPNVLRGDTNIFGVFNPTDEWLVYPNDTFDGLGYHVVSASGAPYVPAGRGGILAPNLSNYLQSAEISGGIGALTFWCRAETVSPPATYMVQTSPDGLAWSNVISFSAANVDWEFKSIYIYRPEHSYVRLLHTAGSNRLYIDEIAVGEPVGIMRIQDFSLWTMPAFTNEGVFELNEWQLRQGYVSTNSAHADFSAWLNPTGGHIRSPLFTDGIGEVTFRHRRSSANDAPLLYVQTSRDLTNWTTHGAVVAASTSTYDQASIFVYEPNPAYIRILCATNVGGTQATVTAYGLVDEISVDYPRIYRHQNFDTWPTRNSYGGAQYQGWIVDDAIVNSENAYAGQSARLRDTVASNAFIQSPDFAPEGVGLISFMSKKWSTTETSPTYEIQTSTNGVHWIVRSTIVITNGADYQRYELWLSDPTARFVRIYHTLGAGRAMFDDISILAPQPPASYVLNGWHEPTAPWATDSVHLWLTAVDRYGARDLSVTSFYRIGTSGAFTAVAMLPTNTYFYRTVTPIAPQPTGTIVQYYFRADFQGPGSASSSPMFFPAGGSNNPAWYGIPRSRPGQVWINELSYAPIDFWNSWGMDTNEFIELCGPSGFDLSGWRIVLVYGDQFSGTNLVLNSYAHYRIPHGTVLSNLTNGYGFFVLGDSNWGPGIVNMIFTNYTKYDTNGIVQDNMADGYPDGLILLNEVGGVEYQLSYEGYMPTFRRITASQDYFDTNTVALVGTGSNYHDFAWTNRTGATPGAPNPGQTLVPRSDPPPPPSPPAVINIVRMVWTTNITIYTSGNTNATPWNVLPYYTTNLMTPTHGWLPLTPYNSVYEGGGTNRFWFSPDTNRSIEAYYFRAVPP